MEFEKLRSMIRSTLPPRTDVLRTLFPGINISVLNEKLLYLTPIGRRRVGNHTKSFLLARKNRFLLLIILCAEFNYRILEKNFFCAEEFLAAGGRGGRGCENSRANKKSSRNQSNKS